MSALIVPRTIRGGGIRQGVGGKIGRAGSIGEAADIRDHQDPKWWLAERGTYAGVTAVWHSTSSATKHKVTAGAAAGARRLRKTFASEADAKQAVEAEWNRAKRGAGELSLSLALGRPDIGPETRVTTSGLKEEIDATAWLVSQATHTLDDGGGLVTALQMETVP
jgi:phage protein D